MRCSTTRFSTTTVGFGCVAGLLALLCTVSLLGGCANPVAPTGGPGNTEPARLLESTPADEDVNVSQDVEVVLRFDKYISRGAMAQAFSMTPEPQQRPEFDYSGRSIAVSFAEPLRDSTTYIISLGSDLRTARGNVELDAPITLAFSTGNRIDQGRLAGRVVEPKEGQPEQDVDVFAYALPEEAQAPPDTLPEAPDFRTQTDSEGRFSFQNIREESYYVIAVRDNNRNRMPDANEAYAVPPVPRLSAAVDTASADTAAVEVPWLLTDPRPDPPQAVRVRPQTVQRQTVRFSQPVAWRERTAASWTLVDSTAQDTIGIASVHTATDTPYEVAVVAEQALRVEAVHRLTVPPQALEDSLGRAVPDTTLRFTPSTDEGDPTPEFSGFRPDRSGGEEGRPLTQDEAPLLRTTRPPEDDAWNDSITATDTTGTARTIVPESQDGLRHRLAFEPPLTPEMPVDVRVGADLFANIDTVQTQRYRRLSGDALGAIEVPITYVRRALNPPDTAATTAPTFESITLGVAPPDTLLSTQEARVTAADTAQTALRARSDSLLQRPERLVLEMHDTSPNGWPTRRIETDTTGTARFDRVPEGVYRFRLWHDREGTGRWSPGQIAPYRRADPVVWSESTVEGRARWTNVLDRPLQLLELTTD
ncbi:Ig-like domain-containing protein [Longimonas halophila]|nr:Ig-like domain-containing protein [Longimonas halophila]